ncbi:MAG TPA: hypothetical protein VMW17_16450 [Candidatus Binatia bacterium]|nr:hypothetical protein [Candidatus Binatia bacterium]
MNQRVTLGLALMLSLLVVGRRTVSAQAPPSPAAVLKCDGTARSKLLSLSSSVESALAKCLSNLELCKAAPDPTNCRLGLTNKALVATNATVKAALVAVKASGGACETVAVNNRLTDHIAKSYGAAISGIAKGCQICNGGSKDTKGCKTAADCPGGSCGSYAVYDAANAGKQATTGVCAPLLGERLAFGVCTNNGAAGNWCSNASECNSPGKTDGVCLTGDAANRLSCLATAVERGVFALTLLRNPQAPKLFGIGTTGYVWNLESNINE